MIKKHKKTHFWCNYWLETQDAKSCAFYATLADGGNLALYSPTWKCIPAHSDDISGAHDTILDVLKRSVPKHARDDHFSSSKAETHSDFPHLSVCWRCRCDPIIVPNMYKIPRNQKILKYVKLLKNQDRRTSALSKTPPPLPIFRNKCFFGKIGPETFFWHFSAASWTIFGL